MTEKLKIVWIDDNPEREKDAKNLGESLSAQVKFIGLKNKSVDEKLSELILGEEPDLILMDHSLNNADSITYKTGSTAAFYIREQWPNCPIISITGVSLSEVDVRHKAAYEGMYPIDAISNNYFVIQAVALGFREMKKRQLTSIDAIIDLLKSSEEDGEKIKKILPKEIKENLEDKSLLVEIYRWFSSVLLERPGFLYNRIWVATFLGLNQEGFAKVENIFENAKYKGVFSNKTQERWWKSKVLNILGEEVEEIGLPWEIGRNLSDISPNDFSKCYVAGENFPETVAAEDTTSDANWHPMKLKNTEAHPSFENMLFFEELRIMKPA